VRNEPGIGAFVVELQLEAPSPELGDLGPREIARLRATKRIVGERARAIFVLRTTMPPPDMHGAPP
jgi:hypothetical protein